MLFVAVKPQEKGGDEVFRPYEQLSKEKVRVLSILTLHRRNPTAVEIYTTVALLSTLISRQ